MNKKIETIKTIIGNINRIKSKINYLKEKKELYEKCLEIYMGEQETLYDDNGEVSVTYKT